jgi:hypothetical protein
LRRSPTKRGRGPGIDLAARLVSLVAAAGSLWGCCNDIDSTACFEWSESAICPPPDEAAPMLVDGSATVNSQGTFWPAHDYLIDGALRTEPALCCYEVTTTVCTKELH